VEDVAPHRRCITCGFDVVGLPLTSGCPECQHPIAATVKRRMLRNCQNLRRLVQIGWWCWWGTIAAVALFLIALAGSFLPRGPVSAFFQTHGGHFIAFPSAVVIFVCMGSFSIACFCAAAASHHKTNRCLGLLLSVAVLSITSIVSEFVTLPFVVSSLVFCGFVLTLGGLFICSAASASAALLQTDLADQDRRARLVRILAWAWLLAVAVPLVAHSGFMLVSTDVLGRSALESYRMTVLFRQFWSLFVALPLSLCVPIALWWLTFRALRAAGDEVRATSTIPS
jgi:hypothetical protein